MRAIPLAACRCGRGTGTGRGPPAPAGRRRHARRARVVVLLHPAGGAVQPRGARRLARQPERPLALLNMPATEARLTIQLRPGVGFPDWSAPSSPAAADGDPRRGLGPASRTGPTSRSTRAAGRAVLRSRSRRGHRAGAQAAGATRSGRPGCRSAIEAAPPPRSARRSPFSAATRISRHGSRASGSNVRAPASRSTRLWRSAGRSSGRCSPPAQLEEQTEPRT